MTDLARLRRRSGRSSARWFLGPVLVLALSAPALAQEPAAKEDATEMAALRRSLDQIVVLLRQLVEQTSSRDAATILLSRIDLAEKRLAPLEEDLRGLRERKQAEGKEQLSLKGSFQSIDEMQRLDVTGSARDAFDAERQRVTAAISQKDAAIAELDAQIAAREAELAQRRQAIARMEAQLDGLVKPR